jgi:hypothetical protein
MAPAGTSKSAEGTDGVKLRPKIKGRPNGARSMNGTELTAATSTPLCNAVASK